MQLGPKNSVLVLEGWGARTVTIPVFNSKHPEASMAEDFMSSYDFKRVAIFEGNDAVKCSLVYGQIHSKVPGPSICVLLLSPLTRFTETTSLLLMVETRSL
jgi:hypothetical protein